MSKSDPIGLQLLRALNIPIENCVRLAIVCEPNSLVKVNVEYFADTSGESGPRIDQVLRFFELGEVIATETAV